MTNADSERRLAEIRSKVENAGRRCRLGRGCCHDRCPMAFVGLGRPDQEPWSGVA